MRGPAAAAEDAEAMRVIGHQPGIMPQREIGERR